MATHKVVSGVVRQRCGLPQARAMGERALHGSSRRFSTTAGSVEASGPPFKKFFWITTGIMFGIPGALGAAFVYNLKTDDEFYEHFNDKYPELVATINEYVPLTESSSYADRDDVGEVTPTSELLNETITVVAELRSGVTVRFQAKGVASQAEIEALALKNAGLPGDSVIAIAFEEDGAQSEEDDRVVVMNPEQPSTTITTAAAWPPAPRTMWNGKKKSHVDVVREARSELEAIRLKQFALEESKYAGRDIDEADEEIRQLEERKTELKKLLPRKRVLWIF